MAHTVALSPQARRASVVIAGVGWVALTLQLAVSVRMMTADGHSVVAALWRYLGYFTILTNLLVATMHTRVARDRWPGGPAASPSAITGIVLAIAIVGVVYEVLLSGRVPAMGPVWWTADRLLHYAVPALTVLWWVRFVPASTLTFADALRWLVYPVSYLVYALARGAVDGWYPYFFIDVGRLGYPAALANAFALALAMLTAGLVLVAVTRAVGAMGRSPVSSGS